VYVFVQVTIQYTDRPKSYLLTPSRKKVGKLVARGSKIAIANQFLKDLQLRKHIATKIGKIIHDEIGVMCSNKFGSVLRNQSVQTFSCEAVVTEMKACAPTLLSVLQVCTNGHKRPKCQTQKTNTSMPDSNTIISVCTAILCRHHRPSMSLLQRVVSLILYEGHSSKQVSVC